MNKYFIISLITFFINGINVTTNQYLSATYGSDVALSVTAMRYCINCIVLGLFWRSSRYQKVRQERKYINITWVNVAVVTTLSLILFRYLNAIALETLDSTVASFFEQLPLPISLTLILLFKPKLLNRQDIVPSICYILALGNLLIGNGLLESDLRGVIIGVLAFTCLALNTMYRRYMATKGNVDQVALDSVCMGVGAIFFVSRIGILISNGSLNLWSVLDLKVLGLGLLTTIIGLYSLFTWMRMYKHLEVHLYQFSAYMMIVSCMVLAYLVYGDVPSASTLVSAIVMFIGSLWYIKPRDSKKI